MDPAELTTSHLTEAFSEQGRVVEALSQEQMALIDKVDNAGRGSLKPAGTSCIVLASETQEASLLVKVSMALSQLGQNLIHLVRVLAHGLKRDVLRCELNIIENVLTFARVAFEGVSILLEILKAAASFVLHLVAIFSGALALFAFAWNAIHSAIRLYKSCQAYAEIERILATDKAPENQVREVLKYLKGIYDGRVQANIKHLETVPEESKEKTWLLLEKEMKVELSITFGEQAYELILNSIDRLERLEREESGESLDKLVEDTILSIGQTRDLLKAKIKKEVLHTISKAIAFAATLLGVIFPAFGIGLLIGYSLWLGFCAIFIAEAVHTYATKKQFKNELAFFNQLKTSKEAIDKFYKILCNKIHLGMKSLEGKKADGIARMILSDKDSRKAYIKEAHEMMLAHLKEKMIKRINYLSPEETDVSKTVQKAQNEKELYKLWKQFETKRVKVSTGQIEKEEVKWNAIREHIQFLQKAPPDAFYRGALRTYLTQHREGGLPESHG